MEPVCIMCDEAMSDDDARLIPGVVDGETVLCAIHHECYLLMLVGHDHGLCGCTNYGGTGDRRHAGLLLAMELWEREDT